MLTLVLILTLLPAALAVDLNVDVGFYFKQSRGGTCTLASAAMMLRRRAYFDGLDGWVDVTENSIKSTAWSGGLSHSFTYNAMHVGYATLPSGKAAKTEALIQILAEHPEGIVLYDRRQPHAVILTDYTDGVFYCSDPANGVSAGRVPLSSASISISGASCYWYITSDANDDGTGLEELEADGSSCRSCTHGGDGFLRYRQRHLELAGRHVSVILSKNILSISKAAGQKCPAALLFTGAVPFRGSSGRGSARRSAPAGPAPWHPTGSARPHGRSPWW